MWPDRVSNPGPLTLESHAIPTALSGPAPALKFRKLRVVLQHGKTIVFLY